MKKMDFKILNVITWEKPNPPPNLAGRYFTHSTETPDRVAWNDSGLDYERLDELIEELS